MPCLDETRFASCTMEREQLFSPLSQRSADFSVLHYLAIQASLQGFQEALLSLPVPLAPYLIALARYC